MGRKSKKQLELEAMQAKREEAKKKAAKFRKHQLENDPALKPARKAESINRTQKRDAQKIREKKNPDSLSTKYGFINVLKKFVPIKEFQAKLDDAGIAYKKMPKTGQKRINGSTYGVPMDKLEEAKAIYKDMYQAAQKNMSEAELLFDSYISRVYEESNWDNNKDGKVSKEEVIENIKKKAKSKKKKKKESCEK